jgi:hypothetical protein
MARSAPVRSVLQFVVSPKLVTLQMMPTDIVLEYRVELILKLKEVIGCRQVTGVKNYR